MPSRLARIALPVVAILALLALWELAFRLSGLDPRIFPPPSTIIRTLVRLLSPTATGGAPPILGHLGSSLGNLALAMLLAITLGPLLGLLMGTSATLHAALAPVVNALLPIPPYAYIPIMLLWLGHGWRTIVTTTALAAILPLVYTTTAGVRAIDQRQVFALQSFGAGRLQVFARVVLPAAFAAIVAGLRQSFGQGWRTLVGGEFIAAPASGLGYLIFNARDFLAVDVMFAGILVLSLLGFLSIYVLVGWIESRTLKRWGLLTEGAARR